MALHWNWDLKIGYLTIKEEIDDEPRYFNINIYEGNALAIFLYEYDDDGVEKYSLWNFFADKDHLKNCLKDKSWDWAVNVVNAHFYGDKIHGDMWLIIKDLVKKGKTVIIEQNKPF